MAQTTFNNPIFVKGKGNPDVNYGPWSSVSEFKSYYSDTLLAGTPKVGTTIGVLENGIIVEYWNPSEASPSVFVKKITEGGSGGGSGTSDITIDTTMPVSPTDFTVPSTKLVKNQLATKANTNDLANVALSGSYNDLSDKPQETLIIDSLNSNSTTAALSANMGKSLKQELDGKASTSDIPTVNNAKLTILQGGVEKGSVNLNTSADSTIDVGFGEEAVFTAEFLKKVLICRANNKVYMTSGFDPSPNILTFNGFGEPGTSSTNWVGYGVAATTTAGSRLCIHNVNVEPWKGRKFRFTAGEGFSIAIASGTVTQSPSWNKPYPQTSDLPWNWHASDDPVEVTLGDMLAIMVKKTSGTFDMNSLYSSIWFTFDVEECEDSVANPPRQLTDNRYVGYRIGVLGDSILAGASTKAYKTALDVLVSDYGIIPVPRCQAGTCISPASADYSDRDPGRFVNRLEPTWRNLASGNNGTTTYGGNVWNDPDPFLGVLIFGVNDVLMAKKPIEAKPFVRELTEHYSGGTQLDSTWDVHINTSALDSEGYLASLLELEASVKSAGGSLLNHFYLMGPYNCTWPGNFPMNTLSKNPNGDTGEDFIRIQRQFCMVKGWSYLDILGSQLNAFLPGMCEDNLHPTQRGHQILGDHIGQFLCSSMLTQGDKIFDDVESFSAKKKKWAVIGDSLTARTSYTTKAYHDYIAEQMGLNVVNLGEGGTGYLAGYEDLNNFALKVGDIPENTDFVTVFGSFNDIASLDLQEYEASIGTATSTGYTTICGAINEFFDELYTRFPACKVGVILPTPWKTMTPMYTDAPAHDYVEKLKTICELKGVPYLDLFHQSGLRPWDSANRLAMYSKDLDSGQTDPRGTHPNEAGHAVIASKVREFIKTLI